MKKCFVLSHFFEYGEDNFYEELKIIGVYSSRAKAEQAIERYILLPGFNNYTREAFCIDEATIDYGREWENGFVKADEID